MSDAMTSAERRVAALLDKGLTVKQIIAQTDIPPTTVRRAAGYLGASGADLWMRDARAATAVLLSAIRRHHPEQLGRMA